jgi:oxygen-dependent protoporphyrinogen oxidase
VVVAGAGVAGLAAATAIRRDAPEIEVLVLERSPRVGGLVETERTAEGFIVEHGADCLVTTKPWGVAAAREADLGDAIVPGGPAPRRSYVSTRAGLVLLPQVFAGARPAAVLSVLRTPLLSLAGKARLALEPFVPRRRNPADESVRAFVTRRFGAELADVVVEPLVGAIHGSATGRLSADACMPRLRAFEREHGSVTLGVECAIRARRRRGDEALLPPTVTLRDGMGSLPAALARRLGDRVKRGVAVGQIAPHGGGRFRVDTADGAIACDGVVLATPSWQAPPLIEAASPDLAAYLATIAHKALACVTLAWPRSDVPHRLDATGWVRGAGDRRTTLACTWSSEKWFRRAPDSFVLVRSVLALGDAPDGDLVDAVRRDLRDLLGVGAPPCLVRVRRLPHATPIYEVGHGERVARALVETAELGAFALAGNAYAGVGVPDCVASGEAAARTVLGALAAGPARAA